MANLFTYKCDFGAGDVTVTPVVEGSISRYVPENEIYNRYNVDASFLFYSTNYNNILTYRASNRTIELDIYQDGNFIVTAILDLYGEEDTVNDTIKLQVIEVKDDYRLLLKNIDNDVNILEKVTTRYSLLTSTYLLPLDFSLTAFSSPAVGSLFCTITNSATTTTQNIYARQKYTARSTAEKDLFVNQGWTVLSGNTVVKDWQGEYASYIESSHLILDIGYLPALGGGGSPFSSRTINDQYPDNNVDVSLRTFLWYEETTFTVGAITYYTRYTFWLNNKSYYGSSQVIYPNCRDFFEVVKKLITEANGTLTFDNTDTATDSFYYLKNATNIDTLLIQGITDTLLNDLGNVKNIPSTVLNLKLSEVLEFLKQRFSLYWIIESGVFRFKHLTAQTWGAASSANDTTTYKSVDWSNKLNTQTFDLSKQFDRIQRDELSYTIDFIGLDIVFQNVLQKNLLKISNNKFFVDIQDIFRRPARYSSESINQSVLFNCQDASSDNFIDFFVNDTVNGFNLLATKTISGGDLFSTFEFDDLRRSGAQAVILSNSFSVTKGDTITFQVDYTNNTGTPSYSLRIIELTDDSLETFSGNLRELFATTTVTADGTHSVNHTFTKSHTTIRCIIEKNTTTDYYGLWNNLTITNDRLYKIIETTGALSSISYPNAALSIANCDARDFAYGSDTDVTINGSTTTLAANEVRRFKTQSEITMPCLSNINTQFDFTKYVKTGITTTGVLIQVTQDLNEAKCKIKLEL